MDILKNWKLQGFHNTAAMYSPSQLTKGKVQIAIFIESFFMHIILSVSQWETPETYQGKDESRSQTDWVSGNSG